jgi:hypothetical protein
MLVFVGILGLEKTAINVVIKTFDPGMGNPSL